MADVNGLDHKDQNMAESDVKPEEYVKLVEYGINARVAEELCNVYKTGKFLTYHQFLIAF